MVSLENQDRIPVKKEKVFIVILNWKGWENTIECLESLFRNTYLAWQVIVCDNDSQDGSLEKIMAWAKGELSVFPPRHPPLKQYVVPPVEKPILYRVLSFSSSSPAQSIADEPLLLIQNDQNLGFAGGNNVALRYLLTRLDWAYVWLLNNDTVIHPEALSALVGKIETNLKYGLCGSTVLYYHAPETIQARGGNHYWPWIGRTRHVAFMEPYIKRCLESEIEKQLNCVLGASMLVRRTFIQEIGLMDEKYFLYFEELDWAIRAKGRYQLGYASHSLVYHKEGASIGGGNRNRKEKSELADYFEIRNRILITRTFFPYAIPLVSLGLVVTLVNRVRRKQFKRLWLVLKAWWNGIRMKVVTPLTPPKI